MLLTRGGWVSVVFTTFMVAGSVLIVCGTVAAWMGSQADGFLTAAVGLMWWCCAIITFSIFLWNNPPPLRRASR